MSGLIFEGNLTGFSEVQLNYVKSVLEDYGYKTNKVLVEPVGKLGDNYVANVNRFTVIGNGGETFKIVAKAAPAGEVARQTMNTGILFKNEQVMYTEVLPRLVDLQRSAGISKDNYFRYPICYGSFTEAPNEIILLEDLKESEFVMLDRKKSLSNESIRLVLKDMAVLHSLSYALKKEDPDTFDKFKNKLFNTWLLLEEAEDAQLFFVMLEEDVLNILDSSKYKDKIRSTILSSWKLAKDLHQYDVASRHAVIAQGDSWTNNIMFRLQDGNPVECVMIDYQISKISNPVADLLYLILNCTDYETRSKNFHDWIDFYHSELDKSLHNFGLKANIVYTRDQMDVDFRRLGKYMLTLAIMLASILLRETEDIIDFKAEEIDMKEFQNKIQSQRISALPKATLERFKTKVEGLVDSLVEFGYL